MSRAWCALAVVLLCPLAVRAQGALQRVRQGPSPEPATASAPSPPATSAQGLSANNSDYSWAPGNHADLEGWLAAGALGVLAVSSPFWVPVSLDASYDVTGYFPGHPYALPGSGYLFLDRDGGEPWNKQELDFSDPQYLKPWALRLALEDGNDFRGLNRLGGRLSLDTTWRVGLQSNWNYLHESLDRGGPDEAVLGDTELTFRLCQNDWLLIHIGAGLRTWTDAHDARFGFNFSYSADFFPCKPVIFSPSFDVGNLSSDLVLHGRATLGLIRGRWELYGGYDFLRIGSVNIQGPVAGVRLWF
jgi:hypothetical protein